MVTKNEAKVVIAKKIKVKGQVYVLASDEDEDNEGESDEDQVDESEMTYDDLKEACGIKDDGMGALDLYMQKYFRGAEGIDAVREGLEGFKSDVEQYVLPAISKMF